MTMMFYITLLFAVYPCASIAGQRHIFISGSHHSRSQQSFGFGWLSVKIQSLLLEMKAFCWETRGPQHPLGERNP